ncbi:MAG: putative signal transducing protein [Elusimicrobiota bacterium]
MKEEAAPAGPEVVFTTTRLVEAELVRGLLGARGLLARVIDGNFVSMQPWLSGWAGGIKVVVPAEQAGDARLILDEAGLIGGGGKGFLTR